MLAAPLVPTEAMPGNWVSKGGGGGERISGLIFYTSLQRVKAPLGNFINVHGIGRRVGREGENEGKGNTLYQVKESLALQNCNHGSGPNSKAHL